MTDHNPETCRFCVLANRVWLHMAIERGMVPTTVPYRPRQTARQLKRGIKDTYPSLQFTLPELKQVLDYLWAEGIVEGYADNTYGLSWDAKEHLRDGEWLVTDEEYCPFFVEQQAKASSVQARQ